MWPLFIDRRLWLEQVVSLNLVFDAKQELVEVLCLSMEALRRRGKDFPGAL